MANPTEVLFMALLMVYAADSKAELVAWAAQVLLEERRAAELGPNWRCGWLEGPRSCAGTSVAAYQSCLRPDVVDRAA